MQHATLLFGSGRFIEAEAEIRSSLKEEDTSAYAHALLGLCLVEAGLVDEARGEVKTALSLDPNDAFNHYAMSYAETAGLSRTDFLGQRRTVLNPKAVQGSLQSAQRAVELAPEEDRYWTRLAEILQMRHRWQESIAPAQAALRLCPTNNHAAILLAEALTHLHRCEEARVVLHKALELNPAISKTHTGMGWALLRAGDYQRAEQFFIEALRIQADSEWAQEGALECAKYSFRIHRWLCGIKRWFNSQNRFVAIIAGLALAAIIFSGFSAYFLWVDPLLRRVIGNQGFAIFTLILIAAGSAIIFFHNEIFLWLSRRHIAAKTSIGTRHRQFNKKIVLLMAVGGAFVPVNLFLERYSELAPAILSCLIPGCFSIAIVIHTFREGKRRWLWLSYVLLMLVLSPLTLWAWYKFMEDVPKLIHLAAVVFIPYIPLFIVHDRENRKAIRQRHQNAVIAASRANSD